MMINNKIVYKSHFKRSLMKIAIFIPHIGGVGGGQKVIAKLSSYLQSKGHVIEFFTPFYDKNSPYKEFHKMKINVLKPSSKILMPFLFLFKKVNGFDVFIFDDFPSYFASIRNKPNIMICYTPKREFYDLKEYSYENASFKGKMNLFLKNLLLKKIDFICARKADVIAPISKTVEERVEKYYKRKDSKVIYFGTDFNEYKRGKYENYVLCVNRFTPPKRTDMIIKSMGFVKNKKIRLYVVGDDSSEKEKIKNLSEKYPNVKFLGGVSEDKLKELYSNCLAVIYTPINEDWGLVPIEGAASGKPTIGVNEGGLRETIINNKTGFLIDNVTLQKIAEKIDYLSQNKHIAEKMGLEGYRYAKKFDWKVLLPSIEQLIIKMKK